VSALRVPRPLLGADGLLGAARASRTAALVALLLALTPVAARADADPASDVLLQRNVFYPYEPRATPELETTLNNLLATTARMHMRLKVAVIATPVDLGAIPEYFAHPQPYAAFLESEISYNGPEPLLVVMPDGFGLANIGPRSALVHVPIDARERTNGLVQAAIQAVVALARANGHPLSVSLPGGSASGPSTRLLFGVLAALWIAGGLALGRLRARERLREEHPSDVDKAGRPNVLNSTGERHASLGELLRARIQGRGVNASTPNIEAGAVRRAPGEPSATRVRAYLASDPRRAIQSVLGLIWLLDGALQFQSFMYSKGFVEMLTGNASGQPRWLHDSIIWSAHQAQQHLTVFNTLFALIQCLIGLGLLYRPTVRVALAGSLMWALVVWWFGEAFGMLFMNMADPLTGAPGAVALYAIVGLIVWPNGRAGGLLGVRGARTTWAALWLVMAWLWLLGPNSSANATHGAIEAAPSGMSWLSELQHWAAQAASGNGLPIALVLGALSAAIGIAVAANWHPRPFIIVAIALSVAYWVLGQGFGGIAEGGATDPDTGPLFALLAVAMYTLLPTQELASGGTRDTAGAQPVAVGG
jgi:hypothetical protein